MPENNTWKISTDICLEFTFIVGDTGLSEVHNFFLKKSRKTFHHATSIQRGPAFELTDAAAFVTLLSSLYRHNTGWWLFLTASNDWGSILVTDQPGKAEETWPSFSSRKWFYCLCWGLFMFRSWLATDLKTLQNFIPLLLFISMIIFLCLFYF